MRIFKAGVFCLVDVFCKERNLFELLPLYQILKQILLYPVLVWSRILHQGICLSTTAPGCDGVVLPGNRYTGNTDESAGTPAPEGGRAGTMRGSPLKQEIGS